MLHSRAAIYFDEVARRGSIRRASEHLGIAASAIDRQILNLEENLGTRLFERTSNGVRLTAAGELLIDSVRRWRRDFERVRTHIDDLSGLRRGSISIATVEGAAEFLTRSLSSFLVLYPGIAHRVTVSNGQAVIDAMVSAEHDIGLTFNPPNSHALRVEETRIYQMGAVVNPAHPLARCNEVALTDCATFPLLIPDESISLRGVFDQLWSRRIGSIPIPSIQSNNLATLKSLASDGQGVAMLTPLDCCVEIAAGDLNFIPLSDPKVPLSVLGILTSAGRGLSVPASLLVRHLSNLLASEGPMTRV